MPKSDKPKKKRTNGYEMPEPLPKGEIFQDISKKEWILGPSIGKGGFGEIYSARDASAKASSNYPYVIKIEPHGNGPLFVEMHFYMKCCKEADIEEFKRKHNLKSLGIPAYLGSGSHEFRDKKYRFIVMEQFGNDIDKVLQNKKEFSPNTAFLLSYHMTNILEYIHCFGYVHADLKGQNILLGIHSSNKNQPYLVDFGLATKYSVDKPFKPNPKKAHDGTIEFLSRDAHQGVPTRRGDFEILAYNIIHWLGGKLPWEKQLGDPKIVQQKKEEAMNDVDGFLKHCFNKKSIPDALVKFLNHINSLTHNDEPDYKTIRDIFKTEIVKSGGAVTDSLQFSLASGVKRRSQSAPNTPEKKVKKDVKSRAPSAEPDPQKIKKRVHKKEKNVEKEETIMTAAMKEILAKKQEKEGKKKKTGTKPKKAENGEGTSEVSSKKKQSSKTKSEKHVETKTEDMNGFTEEMQEIAAKKESNGEGTSEVSSKKKQSSKAKSEKHVETKTDDMNGFTEEMKEIAAKKASTRTRRHVAPINYDERTPKLARKNGRDK